MSDRKLSLSFRFLRKLGLVGNEEKYGNVSLFGVVWVAFKNLCTLLAYKYCYSGILLERFNPTKIRPWLWGKIGVHVGKNVRIYHRVALDYLHAHMIFIEDEVSIANGSTLLCHQRNFENYRVGVKYIDLPYRRGEIHLKRGCLVGMNAMIMPGVTVGEGAIVGACSVVTKDVPPWTVAVGSPAKVVREISPREAGPEVVGGGAHDNIKVFSLSGYGRELRRAA